MQKDLNPGTNMKLNQTYVIPFSVSETYAAWVSSSTVIAPATAMNINPVVGGHYRLIMESSDFVGRNEGKFLIVEPDQRIRYTWEWNSDGEVTEIDVTFSEAPEGTNVSIDHSGFTSKDSLDNHSVGWDIYIAGFIAFLEAQ